MQKKFAYLISIGIILVLFLSSCRLIMPSEMFKTEKDFQFSEFKPSEKEYKIKPFDKLSVRVSANDGFKLIDNSSSNQQGLTEMQFLVEFDGKIKLPTLGRVEISGMTLREAEKMLESRYSEFYQKPFIQIKVTNRRVIIFKDGGTTGSVIDIPEENFTLIEAIAQTGGLSNISKSYRIRLIRGDLNNSPQVYIYNIYKLNDLQKANLLLEANDIIYVESRPQYVSKFLTELAPYLSLVSTILLVYGLVIK